MQFISITSKAWVLLRFVIDRSCMLAEICHRQLLHACETNRDFTVPESSHSVLCLAIRYRSSCEGEVLASPKVVWWHQMHGFLHGSKGLMHSLVQNLAEARLIDLHLLLLLMLQH